VIAGAAALVIGFVVWPHDATNTISTPVSGSRPVVFDARGDTVRLPRSWSRAQTPLAPELVDPKELLSVATFPLGAPVRRGVCVGNAPPIGGLASMNRKDAFVWMVEWYANASTDRPRPSRFAPRQFEPRACVHHAYPQLTSKSIFFRDHGRNINIFIVTGNRVTSKREHQLYALLDSLRFSK